MLRRTLWLISLALLATYILLAPAPGWSAPALVITPGVPPTPTPDTPTPFVPPTDTPVVPPPPTPPPPTPTSTTPPPPPTRTPPPAPPPPEATPTETPDPGETPPSETPPSETPPSETPIPTETSISAGSGAPTEVSVPTPVRPRKLPPTGETELGAYWPALLAAVLLLAGLALRVRRSDAQGSR